MNFYVDSGGTVIAVDPEKVYQGQAYANRIRLIGPFASTLAVTVGFTLPNGEIITPQLMTNVNGNLREPFEDFSIWEYVIPKTITNYAGVVKVQFYVHGTRNVLVRNVETGEYEEKPQSTVIATGRSSFNVEKGVPIYPLDGEEAVDYETLLTDILGALSSLQERCKINLENGIGENSVQQKGTTAGFANQMTVGKNNANKENTLFEVGNGESEEECSNAFEVLRDGRAKVQGEPTEETDVVRLKDISNYVTTDTTQNISASKRFELDDGKYRQAVHILNAGILVEVGPTGSFIRSNSTTISAYGIEVQQGTVCSVHYGSTSISYVCDGNDGELQLPISQSGSYILATTDDVAMVETKTEENAETIKFHEKVLFQSGIVGILEKSQAYTARETAEGANIVDGQKTSVLEIAGDTVKTSNLFNRNVSNKTGGATIVTNDENSIVVTAGAGKTYVSANFPIENPEQYIGKTIYISAKWAASSENKGGIRVMWLNISTGITGGMVAEQHTSEEIVSGVVPEKPEGATGLYIMLYANTGGTLVEGDTVTYSNVMVSMNNIAYQLYFAGLKNAFINSIKSTGKNLFNVNTDFIKAVEEKWYTTYPVKVENGIFYSSGKRGIAVGSCICCELVENKDYVLSFIANFDEATEYPATVELNFFNDWTGNKFNSLKNIRKVVVNGGNTITFNSGDCRYVAVGAFSVTLHGTALSNIQIEYGKVATEFEPYKEEIYQLPHTFLLGKYDKINPQTGLIIKGTAYEESETPFTEEQIAGYKNAVVSADGLSLAYERDLPIIDPIDAPKNYTAWKNGTETIIQGETDNSAYGAMPTITQTYFEVLGGEE